MNKSAIMALSLLLTGCASAASPRFINGNYYMGGDQSCTRYRTISDSRIMCMDADDADTGYRDAMTPQQMQMYQYQQAMQQQYNLQSSQRLSRNSQMDYQPMPQFNAPQVMPITQPERTYIRCLNMGMYINCRN